MSVNTLINTAYAFNQPLAGIFPFPIVSKRAPLTTDKAPIGTVWIQPSTNSQWTLTSIIANVATWSSGSGGTGDFSTLVVTGNSTLGTYTGSPLSGTGADIQVSDSANTVSLAASGIISIDSNTEVSILSAGTGANAVLIGSSSGQIHLDGGSDILLDTQTTNGFFTIQSGTGAINIGTDAFAKIITIGNATGATEVEFTSGTGGLSSTSVGPTVFNSQSATAGAILFNALSGGVQIDATTTIALSSTGLVTVAATAPTAASPTAAVTSNANVIGATFTGFTTAAAGTQAFTITSNKITTATPILVTVSNLNASTNGALMGITGITQAAGSIVVSTKNNGSGALGSGDTVLVNVWVL